ncbi:MAG: MBL fold metallo-hydrolase [Spirochaetia bacterium]|nr:MBL fold metallo-hydrolase [Spirochaetia bacterium]
MKVRFLGTGTSHGIPVIGCKCPVCTSADPRNNRYRCSVYICEGQTGIIIDTPPEYRLRAVEYSIDRLDAVLFTHGHFDHTAGLDDVRVYNELQAMDMPVYSDARTLREIRDRFAYVFMPTQEGGGKPKLQLIEAEPYSEFKVGEMDIMPVEVGHGDMKISGFMINKKFAYLTDNSFLPDRTCDVLRGIDVLVLGALRHKPHPTHFSLEQAVLAAKKIGAKKTYFTHMSHALDHGATEEKLPENIRLSYDGLKLEI